MLVKVLGVATTELFCDFSLFSHFFASNNAFAPSPISKSFQARRFIANSRLWLQNTFFKKVKKENTICRYTLCYTLHVLIRFYRLNSNFLHFFLKVRVEAKCRKNSCCCFFCGVEKFDIAERCDF